MSFLYIQTFFSVVDNNRCPISIYSRFLIALFVLGIGLTASVILKELPLHEAAPIKENHETESVPVKGRLESFQCDFEFTVSDMNWYSGLFSRQGEQQRYTVGKQAAELSDCSMDKTYPGSSTLSDGDDRPSLPLNYHTMSEDDLLRHGYIRHITVNGDCLIKLAERYLHDPNRWEEIYQANKNQLTNKAVVPIGIVLIIPIR